MPVRIFRVEADMSPRFEETFGFLGAGKTGETGCSVRFKKRSMIEDIRLW